MKQIKIAEDRVEAKREIIQILQNGFTKEEVHLFTHEKIRVKDIADPSETQEIEIEDQRTLESISNVIHSSGEELRSKMESVGLSHIEAQRFEEDLRQGRIVVVATKNVH